MFLYIYNENICLSYKNFCYFYSKLICFRFLRSKKIFYWCKMCYKLFCAILFCFLSTMKKSTFYYSKRESHFGCLYITETWRYIVYIKTCFILKYIYKIKTKKNNNEYIMCKYSKNNIENMIYKFFL